jgi:hypothetical protein
VRAYPTRVSFVIELNLLQWTRLNDLDYRDVDEAIAKAGAVRNSLVFDGHFGMNVYFSVDYDDTDLLSASEVEKVFEQLLGDKQ